VITGASSGLGFAIARQFLIEGYDVVGVAREQERLDQATIALEPVLKARDPNSRFITIAADVGNAESVAGLFENVGNQLGKVDVLINCVGQSDRGSVAALKAERLSELIHTNVVTALLCSQAALPWLEASGGSVINIGSLAAKVGARHLGAYPAAKHALAGLTQQMRLEWRERGVHVALLSPGPIRREDAGERYKALLTATNVPEGAMRPGGGTTLKGLEPDWIAKQVVRCVKRRTPDVVLPRYVRLLVTLGHLWPAMGDRLLLAMTK
jgi:uncharacterized protein